VTALYRSTAAAVTWTLAAEPALAARMPTRPSPVTPSPPGVMGRAVSSRMKAKAAREVCQGIWVWDRPVPRRHASSTSHKVR
jgi:hypothetical protein